MAIRTSMNVSVTPELEQFVQDLVASGRYHTASEVFREGLRLLEKAEQRRLLEKAFLGDRLTKEEEAKLPRGALDRMAEMLNAKIQEGLDELDRGEGIDGAEFFEKWRARIDSEKAARENGPAGKRRA
jgi:antitoxin ParD1/3/4